MGLIGGDEKAEWRVGVDAAFHEAIDGFEVGIFPFAEVLEGKHGLRSNMGFPAHCYPIAEWLQVVDDALRARIGEGVVRVGSGLEGRLPCIDIMACR